MSDDSLRTLYPELVPFSTGRLRVDATHELYYEQYGNPSGKPALFVHGGPGGGSNRAQARFWDPARYHIVLYDQRGCGRSTPHASLVDNTTWHLVADMEALRQHLGVSRFQVFGGSWGSTLSLAYAQTHPQSVSELVLRGIFMLRKREIDWFYQEGASRIFPDAWEQYVEVIPEAERGDMVRAYYARLTGDDQAERLRAAKAWSIWEASTSTLHPNSTMRNAMGRDDFALAFARIECHYFTQDGFFDRDDQLLAGVDALRQIPAVIVQGRYDMVCPMESAWALHRAWPEADLRIAAVAGHSAFEPQIQHELVSATDRFAQADRPAT